jgi:hypothetical protein
MHNNPPVNFSPLRDEEENTGKLNHRDTEAQRRWMREIKGECFLTLILLSFSLYAFLAPWSCFFSSLFFLCVSVPLWQFLVYQPLSFR